MFLVQLLLPQDPDHRRAHDGDRFAQVRHELTARFGGVTAYLRSPATGLWKDPAGGIEADSVVMVEVQVATLDRAWWRAYRHQLEDLFQQDTILVRAIEIDQM